MARNQHLSEHRHIWWDTRGAEKLPYQSNVFGATFLSSGVLTKEDLVSVGPELSRVTRSGGVVALMVPMAATFLGFYELFREALEALGLQHRSAHLDAFQDSLFDEDSLRVDLAAIGVREADISVVTWDVDFSSGDAFLQCAPVSLLYLPYWLQIVEDDPARESVFSYVRNAMDTYYHGLDIKMPVHVAGVYGVVR
jgi:hypothetical protein